jgi:hypothetical protein
MFQFPFITEVNFKVKKHKIFYLILLLIELLIRLLK